MRTTFVLCFIITIGFFTRAGFISSAQANNVQFSSVASQDGINVYGTATLSPNSQSNFSYRVTVTVTSPSGRTNTTQSDWSPATITHTTGLSIDLDDGTFTVQATVERQGGSYDEFDNFNGDGNIETVGNSNSSVLINPKAFLGEVSPLTQDIESLQEKSFNFSVYTSRGAPNRVKIKVEFNIVSNFNNVEFDSTPENGIRELTVTPAGTTKSNNFKVKVKSTSPTGTVTAEIRIQSAVDADTGESVEIPEQGDQRFKRISFRAISPNANGCSPECFEPNIGCPCYGDGGIFGNLRPSCNPSLSFVKANYSPKSAPIPQCWCSSSPIVIDVAGNRFSMTDAANGVPFDFNGDGVIGGKLAWTTANSDDAWLVLDRNNNNRIDNGQELFGNATPQPMPPVKEERQGFLALAEYDKTANGGNNDGKITRRDLIFRKLRLWQDKNHNGISEIEELSRLPALDVVAIFLDYRESRRTDEFGNQFKYRARIRDRQGANIGRWAWDVFVKTTR